MNILVEESGELKQEECENSQLKFYLDNEMQNPFVLEKDAEVFKDHKRCRISFSLHSPENTYAQGVARVVR